MKAEKLGNKQGEVKGKVLLNVLADTEVEIEAQQFWRDRGWRLKKTGDTLRDV